MAAPSPYITVLLLHPPDIDPAPVTRILEQHACRWDAVTKASGQSLAELAANHREQILLWWCDEVTLATSAELRQIRQVSPAQPIVLLPPKGSRDEAIDLLHAGATEVVTLDKLDTSLPRSLRHLRLRTLQLRKTMFRERMVGLEEGFAQGSARLLHDINSPMTAIQNAIDMIELERRKSGAEPTSREKMLSSSIEHLRRIIDHWHDVLYSPSASHTEVNLYAALRIILEILRDDSGTTTLETTPAELHPGSTDPLPELLLHAEPFALEQVFHHIVRNALEAVAGQDDARIRVEVEVAEDDVRVVFDNNGPPVAPDLATTLWKDFITDKQGHSGMGLGVVRYLLMQTGGSIALGESRLGGACFVVTFRRKARRMLQF